MHDCNVTLFCILTATLNFCKKVKGEGDVASFEGYVMMVGKMLAILAWPADAAHKPTKWNSYTKYDI